jgi:pimeloyl-ACP methyl ester carboxylesterase
MRRHHQAVFGFACFGGLAAMQAFTIQKPIRFTEVACKTAKCRAVQLASTVTTPILPTTVFVHGLDSSKETWSGPLSRLSKMGYPAIALDLRGHGESPLGDVKEYTPENLASDVLDAVEAHGIRSPFVLVGHSMGGRIAMRLAAMEVDRYLQGKSPRMAACIIEDMDIRIRDGPKPPDDSLDPTQRQQIQSFERDGGRLFSSWEECRRALLPCNPLPSLRQARQDLACQVAS